MVLSNRSIAFVILGDSVFALVDADVVIQIKRNWSKGHFQKAKALQGLKDFEEAKLAGLQGSSRGVYQTENRDTFNISLTSPCRRRDYSQTWGEDHSQEEGA
ncbi:hypothetical protein M422DRAFT_264422 [Sphaerobolus stellatus SS14]|uniref:Uncharacterized protein n=1 Tax=Sphaerobolus stellatus (strain SS14) TaxID=990650 RepID=A0A0C9V8K0_SPHS4|nr:hypothetical protein M422DRAFT_264422 [Sphaerobolus stellatus SS14]